MQVIPSCPTCALVAIQSKFKRSINANADGIPTNLMIDFNNCSISVSVSCHMVAQEYIFVCTSALSFFSMDNSSILCSSNSDSPLVVPISSYAPASNSSRSFRRRFIISDCSSNVAQYRGETNKLRQKKKGSRFFVFTRGNGVAYRSVNANRWLLPNQICPPIHSSDSHHRNKPHITCHLNDSLAYSA